jgi:adenylate kinase
MKLLAKAGHPIKAVILLQIPETEALKRLDISHFIQDRGNRTDDVLEVLRKKLKTYHDKTLPVIEFYRKLNLLIEIDGTYPLDIVTSQIISSLLEFSLA